MSRTDAKISCQCGNEFDYTANYFDQAVLSTNFFTRIHAMSNHAEYGLLRDVQPGTAYEVKFSTPFEVPAFVQFGPGGGFLFAKEHGLTKDSMWILTSVDPKWDKAKQERYLSWSVYGLVQAQQLPLWHVLFYGAMAHLHNELLKPALLDYAASFEAFISQQLRDSLSKKHSPAVADYLLDKTWRIEERCKDLLKFAIGHKLTERSDVYQPWDENVRGIRNKIGHAEPVHLDAAAVENAHQAVFQAIRWIQSVA